jgi:hypothetical protein
VEQAFMPAATAGTMPASAAEVLFKERYCYQDEHTSVAKACSLGSFAAGLKACSTLFSMRSSAEKEKILTHSLLLRKCERSALRLRIQTKAPQNV